MSKSQAVKTHASLLEVSPAGDFYAAARGNCGPGPYGMFREIIGPNIFVTEIGSLCQVRMAS